MKQNSKPSIKSTSGNDSIQLEDDSQQLDEIEMENVLNSIQEYDEENKPDAQDGEPQTNQRATQVTHTSTNNDGLELIPASSEPNDNDNVDDNVKSSPTIATPNEDDFDDIDDFVSKLHTPVTPNKPNTYSIKVFFKNGYFYARLIIIAVTMLLLLLQILYASGSLLSLDLANISCPQKTTEEILAHSKSLGLDQGDVNGCWRSKGFTVSTFLINCFA